MAPRSSATTISGPASELQDRHVFVRVEPDMFERGAQIKMGRRAVASDRAGLPFEFLRPI